MRIPSLLKSIFTCLLTTIFLVGCADSDRDSQAKKVSGPPPETVDAHDHDHGDEHQGPHDGHVIELGRNHEYHAEIVEDHDQKLVSVYILGKDIKELPIETNKLSMSLMVDGKPKNFELGAANPNAGKASRFDATDTSLFEAFHDHEASGKLRVSINGTPYVANLEHHDHAEGHDGHDDHDHDDHGHGDDHDH